MEIYFDKKRLNLLSAIYRSGDNGISWDLLQRKFGETANPAFLESLCRQDYIGTADSDGNWINYERNRPFIVTPAYRSYILPRGRELLETRRFNFWRWVLPTLISVFALIVSVISLLLNR